MRPRPPPVATLALAFISGCALAMALASFLPSIPPLSPLALLVLPFLRPEDRRGRVVALSAAVLAGSILTHGRIQNAAADCRLHLEDGATGPVFGWFESPPGSGTRPFQLVEGLGCRGEVRVLWSPTRMPEGEIIPRVGSLVSAVGRWQRSPRQDPSRPHFAGVMVLADLEVAPDRIGSHFGRTRAHARGRVQAWIAELFPRSEPIASALILARKEGLAPEVRESFALSGISHLLAISGFHVGVVALLLGALVRGLGLPPRPAPAVASLLTWGYVGFIGFPDAATRAALILTLMSVSRLRGRAAGSFGAIASALLILSLSDPFALTRPGFQLSFAGALGLVVGAPPIRGHLGTAPFRWLPPSFRSPLAAGVAATLFTLPFVAWHFGRVSVVGIATTLAATPLVAAAIPGLLVTLAVYPLVPSLATFLAGGTDLLLRALEALATVVGRMPGASVWVGEAALLGGIGGLMVAVAWMHIQTSRLRPWVRNAVVALTVAAGALAAPIAERGLGSGTIEIVFLNVGQGDAAAIRSPSGRWVVIDTGPRGRDWDAGASVVLPYLRRRGVTRLESLILTHPDLDHIGGARVLTEAFRPRMIMDPAEPTGKEAYLDVLEVAVSSQIPWIQARRGFTIDFDGAQLTVLHPDGPTRTPAGKSDSNAQSVVILLQYGAFEALLTGDAPTEVEEGLLEALPGDLELLKVGHHGSDTSTSVHLLSRTAPELAVISVGARNRYGHPHPSVVQRLKDSGVRVLRTDQAGHIAVRGRRGGLWEVRTQW